jgi:putative ATP-binding cassette transporter
MTTPTTAAATAPAWAPLDRQVLRRLVRVVRLFVRSDGGGRAALMGGVLVLLLLTINGLNVVNSYVGRDFMTAIEQRDARAFAAQALLYAAVFTASTIAAVVCRFTEERLGLFWREWFTRRLAALYLERRFYFQLKVGGGLPNPDQRIADDVRAFTTTTLSLALIFLNGSLTVIAFSGVLWSISRALFATAVVYAGLGSALAYRIGRPLVRLNYDQSDREADFRAELVRVREHAESIALLGNEPQLRARLFAQIDAFAANLRRIIAVNRKLGFFTTGYNYMIQLIPALVVAPLFIRGEAQFGVIPQSAMAFAQLIGAFSLIVTQFPQLTSYAAVLARLNALADAHEQAAETAASGIALDDDDRAVAFERVTLLAPTEDRPLLRELTADLSAADHVLITVPDHLVLVAIGGALAGLWQRGSGRIRRPRDIQFLPEGAHLPRTSLRALLGGGPAASDIEAMRVALRRAGLPDALERAGGPDAECDWNAVMAEDEQRLINVARVFLRRPTCVVLATPTTAFGAVRAGAVLAALREEGIGYIILEHEAVPGERFDHTIAVAADGSWMTAIAAAACATR